MGVGVDASVCDEGIIKAYTGSKDYIETAIEGVIGLSGLEPGKGPGIVIKDVENSGIDMIWTNGLTGCMGLAIIGRDKSGKLDVFFSHARHYDKDDSTTDVENPMSLAKQFVDSHSDIRVFWGTDFNFGVRDMSGPSKRAEAQKVLSAKLGCWVRDDDCIVSKDLVFFPRLGLMTYGTPSEAYEWACHEDVISRSEFSKSKVLSKFEPDADLVRRLEQHLNGLKSDRSSWIRFYPYDSRRSNKILVLEQIIEAYKVGNFDLLRRFADSATKKDSPYTDESAKNMWSAWNESVTAKLALEAYNDAFGKISKMGANGCGLMPDGSNIYSFKEYKKIVSEVPPSETLSIV
jgi:hypothetical protein